MTNDAIPIQCDQCGFDGREENDSFFGVSFVASSGSPIGHATPHFRDQRHQELSLTVPNPPIR